MIHECSHSTFECIGYQKGREDLINELYNIITKWNSEIGTLDCDDMISILQQLEKGDKIWD